MISGLHWHLFLKKSFYLSGALDTSALQRTRLKSEDTHGILKSFSFRVICQHDANQHCSRNPLSGGRFKERGNWRKWKKPSFESELSCLSFPPLESVSHPVKRTAGCSCSEKAYVVIICSSVVSSVWLQLAESAFEI